MKFHFSYVYGSNDKYCLDNIVLEEGDDKSEVVIPDTYNRKPVTQIGDCIFVSFGSELKSVVFGDNVEFLPMDLFTGTPNLEKIYLGKNIRTINNSFENCPNFKDVYFNGTQDEWEALSDYGVPQRFEEINCEAHFGTKCNVAQLRHNGTIMYPVTHWDCIRGKKGLDDTLLQQFGVDLSNLINNTLNHYVQSNGAISDISTAYTAYCCDLSLFTPKKFTTYVRAIANPIIAFYSSTTEFNDTTYLGGIFSNKKSEGLCDPFYFDNFDSANYTYKSDNPDYTYDYVINNAKMVLFIKYLDKTFELKGYTNEAVLDGSITADKIADGAVTPEKLSKDYATKEYVDDVLSQQSELNLLDLINETSKHYVKADGTLTASKNYTAYYCDLQFFTPKKFTTYIRSTALPVVTFYSSTTIFDSTTYLGGLTGDVKDDDKTFDNIDAQIPDGSVMAIFIKYSDKTIELTGYENNIAENINIEKTYYIGTNHEYPLVTDAIDAWKSENKPNCLVVREAALSTHIYRVGTDKPFKTVIDAVAQWNDDGKPCATIFVDSGVYITASDPSSTDNNPLQIIGGENRITIIGENRESTIIKSTTGKYIHPPIDIKGGNVTLKNITFIADHSNIKNFVYNDPNKSGSKNSAYAVHCDSGDSFGGVVEIENCNLWSWQSCGLGCGTIKNSQIIVRDCDIRSYVDAPVERVEGADDEESAKYLHGTRGAIVYHSSGETQEPSNEGFTLINSTVYLKGGANIMKISNGATDGFKMITFVNNVFTNDIEAGNKIFIDGNVYLNGISSNNNLDSVNAKAVAKKLIIK